MEQIKMHEITQYEIDRDEAFNYLERAESLLNNAYRVYREMDEPKGGRNMEIRLRDLAELNYQVRQDFAKIEYDKISQ